MLSVRQAIQINTKSDGQGQEMCYPDSHIMHVQVKQC